MPELPEVYTISKDLDKHVTGHVIKDVSISKGYKVFPDNNVFKSAVIDKRINKVGRIAKNIIMELEGSSIGFHLAMTGRLFLRNSNGKDKWVKVVFHIADGNQDKELRFTDMRMFGKVKLYDQNGISLLKGKYGPEPISDDGFEHFFNNIKKKRTNIKNFLLDQSLVSGLGNIYATDALFIAKIHPETPTQSISRNTAKRLWNAAGKILNEGISHRGSTLPDRMYVDIFGNEGSHQDYFRVYMKENCPVCGSNIEYIKLNGRGTYFCPVCQNESLNGDNEDNKDTEGPLQSELFN